MVTTSQFNFITPHFAARRGTSPGKGEAKASEGGIKDNQTYSILGDKDKPEKNSAWWQVKNIQRLAQYGILDPKPKASDVIHIYELRNTEKDDLPPDYVVLWGDPSTFEAQIPKAKHLTSTRIEQVSVFG